MVRLIFHNIQILIQHSNTPILHLIILQIEFAGLGLSLMIARLLIFSHGIQPPQFLETVINQCPDAIFSDINFAFAVVGSTAGAVDQAFVTVGHRADAAGFTDDTGAALGTDFIKRPESGFFADK